ncbi:YqzL family protein [Shouchella lonarensis]|uniref:YqzL-like protein n=1 Tax=Shouchella lonarensis TaxID=1464122 RepID=A0A1G6KKA4_9BACI|nr:YqzL family protein [Shouchella lonarensis]SDC31394.1 YqzL-like protein [Shouchella lonarensis]
MLELLWKVFSQTGNVDMYLLLKELEENGEDLENNTSETGSLGPSPL